MCTEKSFITTLLLNIILSVIIDIKNTEYESL
jgi:hypothetical protein